MGCFGSTRRKRLPNSTFSSVFTEKNLTRKHQQSFSHKRRSSFESSNYEITDWRASFEAKNSLNGSFIDRARSASIERIGLIKEIPKRRDVFSVFADQGFELEVTAFDEENVEKVDNTLPNVVVSPIESTAPFHELPPAVSPSLQCIKSLGICYGSSCQLGNCKLMEDAMTIQKKNLSDHEVAFFGVYDGHGGRDVAEFLVNNLHKNIMEYMELEYEPDKSVSFGCARTDLNIYEQQVHGGSTAIFCLVEKDKLYLGSVGDSQAVLSSRGQARNMCMTHKPSAATERQRIEQAQGKIIGDRIFGILGVSRAFGDNDFKTSRGEFSHRFEGDLVSSEPDIVRHTLGPDDEFLVLGCDGIFDVLSPQHVVDFVRSRLEEKMNIQLITEQLTQHAQAVGSTDNVSAIVLCFHQEYSREKDK